MKRELTAERLRELLSYDSEMGIFTWLKPPARMPYLRGHPAGTNRGDGYVRVMIEGRPFFAHRLAWLYMTGVWPVDRVDHWDEDKSNNRWGNLRESTASTNGANRSRPRNNKSGLKGVYLDARSGKWIAQLHHLGRNKYLGRFNNKDEAAAAYLDAAVSTHGEFGRA